MEKRWLYDEIATDREDAKKIAKSLEFQWIKDLLTNTGMKLIGCFPEESDLPSFEDMSIDNKAALRKALNDNDLLISRRDDGGTVIYLENDVIGEWANPTFELHTDLSQLDPKKRLFTVISISFWSVFDGMEEEIEEDEED